MDNDSPGRYASAAVTHDVGAHAMRGDADPHRKPHLLSATLVIFGPRTCCR